MIKKKSFKNWNISIKTRFKVPIKNNDRKGNYENFDGDRRTEEETEERCEERNQEDIQADILSDRGNNLVESFSIITTLGSSERLLAS